MDRTASGYDPIIVQPVPPWVNPGDTYLVAVVLDREPGENTYEDEVVLLEGEATVSLEDDHVMTASRVKEQRQRVVPDQQVYIFQLTAPQGVSGKNSTLTAYGKNRGVKKSKKVKYK